jgi:hypothetical protein
MPDFTISHRLKYEHDHGHEHDCFAGRPTDLGADGACSLYASSCRMMGAPRTGVKAPAAHHVEQAAQTKADALGAGLAIGGPCGISAESRHQPIGFGEGQITRRRSFF